MSLLKKDRKAEILFFFQKHIESIEKEIRDKKEDKSIQFRLNANQKVYNIISHLPKVTSINDVTGIDGIGKESLKKIEKVLKGDIIIQKEEKKELKISHSKIDQFNESLKSINFGKTKFIICGSYRRKTAFSNDIDILIYNPLVQVYEDVEKHNVLENFITLLDKHYKLEDLTSRKIKYVYRGICYLGRIDIKVAPIESLITSIVHYTGSKFFNIWLRKRAISLGYKLSEYGLFSKKEKVKIESEKQLFTKLGLKYIKPVDRI